MTRRTTTGHSEVSPENLKTEFGVTYIKEALYLLSFNIGTVHTEQTQRTDCTESGLEPAYISKILSNF